MAAVHAAMPISGFEYDAFVTIIAGLNDENAQKVRAFLDFTAPDICAGCPDYKAPTLCEKWSEALEVEQITLVSNVVNGVAGKLFEDPLTKPFFNGEVPCDSRDFIGNLLNRAG